MKALELTNICKTYEATSKTPRKVALSNFNMEVEKGSIFGLLGPNGAGKSTIINILAGTVNKTSGTAKIMGVDIDQDPKLAKRKIGVVPQEIALDTFFTVEEGLEFYAGYFGIRPENRRTKEILKALGLIDKANSSPRQLSGGMKRRFLVAKAMVHSPDVLILDEPTAGVDIELRDQLWSYVKQLNNMGTTIILTTHYLEEAENLCDKIAFINHGNLIKTDTKQNLLSSLLEKELKVKLTNNISDIPAALKKYDIKICKDNSLLVKYNKKETILSKILDDIHNSGIEITDIQVNEGNLEDIFRELYK